MATIAFTSHLQDVGPIRPAPYAGATVAEVLNAAAADYPRLKTYVLDDQGHVRSHVAIFVDGALKPRSVALSLPVGERTEVQVFKGG